MSQKLSWVDINIAVGDKTLVDNNSGDVGAGELMAIMGPSGSGKTTLLNYLSNKVKIKGSASGTIQFNGCKISNSNLKQISRYVEQEDHLIGSLTVYETLNFAGKLSGLKNNSYRNDKISQILNELGLTKVKNVIIGTPIRKGISGGQKRRVSIGCELITMPTILFLDEPTSGLDSKSSYEVISNIKKIAKQENIIVIASIHQPSSTTFNLFDKVMFLSNGKTVYNGKVENVVPYFQNQGIEFQQNQSVSEVVLDMINTDFDVSESGLSLDDMHEYYINSEQKPLLSSEAASDSSVEPKEFSAKSKFACTPCYQTYVLIQRSLLKASRDILAYYIRIFMYVGLAIMMGTVWLRLNYNQEDIQLFINAIFFSGAFMSFMAVAYIPAYLEDYNSYKRENSNGLYGTLPFVVSNFAVSIPFLFITTLLFSIITFFLVNFDKSAKGFWLYLMWLFLDLVAAESLAVLITSVLPYFVISLALTAFANGLWMSVGGFLVSEKILNVFWYYTFYWIDYQRYVFQGMMFNQFSDSIYNCAADCNCMYSSELQGQCKISGNAVLESLGYTSSDIGFWVGMLIVLIFSMRLLTYMVLRYKAR